MIRVRHYTRVSSMRKILAEGVIRARDQNKVFVEKASSRKLSPADAVVRYGLAQGKGNAYVEFDIEDELLLVSYNPVTRRDEFSIAGDVVLADRNAVALFNF